MTVFCIMSDYTVTGMYHRFVVVAVDSYLISDMIQMCCMYHLQHDSE